MSSPLDLLRARVARVLAARGEAPDALRVRCGPWGVSIGPTDGEPRRHPLTGLTIGNGMTTCDEAWRALVDRLVADVGAAREAHAQAVAALHAAARSLARAEATLAAARETEDHG